jgi:hypothetical protein
MAGVESEEFGIVCL